MAVDGVTKWSAISIVDTPRWDRAEIRCLPWKLSCLSLAIIIFILYNYTQEKRFVK